MDNQNPLKELIRLILKQLGSMEKEGAACCGATIGQCQAIQEIGLAKELSLNQLAELLNLDKSTMSRTVNNLVTQGFAERITPSSDRRSVKIELTEKGKTVFYSIDKGLESYFQSILAGIPGEKQQQVVESLWLLVDSVSKCKCC